MFFQSAAMVRERRHRRRGGFFSIGTTENHHGRSVHGDSVDEMTQILADGNRINNKTTASLARDSQGRTRREKLWDVGPWQVNGPNWSSLTMPTSQTNYVLDPTKQTVAVLKHAGSRGSMLRCWTDYFSERSGGFKVSIWGKAWRRPA